jgi:hypothetical protein
MNDNARQQSVKAYFDGIAAKDMSQVSQGLNQPKTESRTIARAAFLLHILEFQKNEILMGSKWVPRPSLSKQI